MADEGNQNNGLKQVLKVLLIVVVVCVAIVVVLFGLVVGFCALGH